MGVWNDDLRRRQQAGEVGLVGRSGQGGGFRRGVYLPLAVAVVGLVLVFVGPVPGLGVFLVMGGLLAAPLAFVSAWLGK